MTEIDYIKQVTIVNYLSQLDKDKKTKVENLSRQTEMMDKPDPGIYRSYTEIMAGKPLPRLWCFRKQEELPEAVSETVVTSETTGFSALKTFFNLEVIAIPPDENWLDRIAPYFDLVFDPRRITWYPDTIQLQSNQGDLYDAPQLLALDRKIQSRYGDNVKICVIDSGVDTTHPAFKKQFQKGKNYQNFCAALATYKNPWRDVSGHGSHCASIAYGLTWKSDQGNHLSGVVTHSKTGRYMAKVFPDSENGGAATADILYALQWATFHEKVDVISMSLGNDYHIPNGESGISKAVKRCIDYGVFFSISAGNSSRLPSDHSNITPPGDVKTALTCGAINKDKHLSYFSSKGDPGGSIHPYIQDEPDCVLPGEAIVAAFSRDRKDNKGIRRKTEISMSGTSMAAPFGAGIAALIISYLKHHDPDYQRNPTLVKRMIKQSSSQENFDRDYEPWEVGVGLPSVKKIFQSLEQEYNVSLRPSKTDQQDEDSQPTQNPGHPGEGDLGSSEPVPFDTVDNIEAQQYPLRESCFDPAVAGHDSDGVQHDSGDVENDNKTIKNKDKSMVDEKQPKETPIVFMAFDKGRKISQYCGDNGRYELLELIGSGGCSYVFRARDKNLPHLPIAIKVLNPSHYGSHVGDLFENEISILMKLSVQNKHLVDIRDTGEILLLEDEKIHRKSNFYVMEYFEKGNLAKSFIDLDVSIDYMKQLLDGLAFIHNNKIIHRDIKPENIFMGNDGLLKIADFGISKYKKKEIYHLRTVVGGTPGYRPPELSEKRANVGYEVDTYCLAKTWYALVTGRRNITEGTIEKLPPGIIKNEKVAEELLAILTKATREKPSDRYRSVNSFQKAILAFEKFLQDPEAFEEKKILATTGKNMVKIRGGSFTDNGKKIALTAFYMDIYPVTNRAYYEFVKAGNPAPAFWQDGKYPEGQADHPVVGIDYNQAEAYARWKGKRLPTANEWEAVIANMSEGDYPWGKTSDKTLCNSLESGIFATTPVNHYDEVLKKRNKGFMKYPRDMIGNTWEWTAIRNSENRQVIKGGSFQNSATLTNGKTKKYQSREYYSKDLGFRCALDK